MKTNTICWIGLILLTIAGFSASERGESSQATLIILTAALIKSLLIGWRFMELHAAHALWKGGFLVMIGGILGLVYLLT